LKLLRRFRQSFRTRFLFALFFAPDKSQLDGPAIRQRCNGWMLEKIWIAMSECLQSGKNAAIVLADYSPSL